MNEVVEFIKENKMIAILRGVAVEKIGRVAKALYEGGVKCIEVTFNQSGDPEDTVKGIEAIINLGIEDLYVGAGTVMSVEQVDLAYKAGAKYIISPNLDEDVIKHTKELGLVSMPGCLTPSEIAKAYKLGADIVKVFPAGILGAGYIKQVKAPLSNIPLAAVGGVKLDNIKEFVDAGINCFGISKYILDYDAIEKDDYVAVAAKAKSFMDLIK